MKFLTQFWHFTKGSANVVSRGNRSYYAWIGLLLVVILVGALAYANQFQHGLITSNMRDQVSWGFYIGNFAFLVGVAAAAVVLVIPAYVYRWGPLKEVVLLAEILAISAIIMCILFVTVDIGRPDRIWHMMPLVGNPNFPYSILVWDVFVLTSYFAINLFVVTYILFEAYHGKHYSERFALPLIFLSIPMAISIHTVTAFLFMGLKARPFWNVAILAPRFIVSAFCSGPALLIIIFMVLRKLRPIPISDTALFKIGELLAYSLAIDLFFIGAESFREFYAATAHVVHAEFQWLGIQGGEGIATYTWISTAFELIAFIIFLVPTLRKRLPLLALGSLLAIAGVFVAKGLGLLLPGMTPDTLGEVYHYQPSLNEVLVGAGVWAAGALAFTLMAKVALAINLGEVRSHRLGSLQRPAA